MAGSRTCVNVPYSCRENNSWDATAGGQTTKLQCSNPSSQFAFTQLIVCNCCTVGPLTSNSCLGSRMEWPLVLSDQTFAWLQIMNRSASHLSRVWNPAASLQRLASAAIRRLRSAEKKFPSSGWEAATERASRDPGSLALSCLPAEIIRFKPAQSCQPYHDMLLDRFWTQSTTIAAIVVSSIVLLYQKRSLSVCPARMLCAARAMSM